MGYCRDSYYILRGFDLRNTRNPMKDDFMQLQPGKVCNVKEIKRAALTRTGFLFIDGGVVKTLNAFENCLGSLLYLLLYMFLRRKRA